MSSGPFQLPNNPAPYVAFLIPAHLGGSGVLATIAAATRALGLELRVVSASSQRDIDTAFMILAQQGIVALAVSSDPLFNSLTEQIAALAARHAIPAIYPLREYVAAGGLISYGTSLSDIYRQVGIYTAKILKGEKPAGLPVQQSTKMELFEDAWSYLSTHTAWPRRRGDRVM